VFGLTLVVLRAMKGPRSFDFGFALVGAPGPRQGWSSPCLLLSCRISTAVLGAVALESGGCGGVYVSALGPPSPLFSPWCREAFQDGTVCCLVEVVKVYVPLPSVLLIVVGGQAFGANTTSPLAGQQTDLDGDGLYPSSTSCTTSIIRMRPRHGCVGLIGLALIVTLPWALALCPCHRSTPR
jgi:hypothetical protein